MNPDQSRQWLATCPRGLAPLLARELGDLGAEELHEESGGVRFTGDRALMYRVCLWSRLANRVLLPLGSGDASDADSLYASLMELPWDLCFAQDTTIAVDFFGSNAQIRNTRFGAQRSKDAIMDRCRDVGVPAPRVSLENPDLRIQVRLQGKRVDAALDMVGESLHRRGYRVAAGAAPLKENLAAAILLRADWPAMAREGAALIDPMCGSATLLLEGALMAADRAPALGRSGFGFEAWRDHDSQQWQAIHSDARGRAERGVLDGMPEIRGYDGDPAVVRRAQENISAAGLSKWVRVSVKSLGEVRKPTHKVLEQGLIVTNPPYGERLGDRGSLPALYRRLGELMHDEFSGWQAAVLAGDRDLGKALGLRSHKQFEFLNGRLPVTLVLLNLTDNRLSDAPLKGTPGGSPGSTAESPPASPWGASSEATSEAAIEAAGMFANRVQKNLRRLKNWLKKSGYDSYRLYDADIPEYAVAVDRYGDWLHVSEYRAPAGVDEDVAAERLRAIMSVLPEATGIEKSRIVLKRRERQRGKSQYTSRGRGGDMLTVHEGEVRLLVNLHDYLDTGLFLDHRPLRLSIGAEAGGKSFLNLFCYTGSATIHAAMGGATKTTSVDLSNSYLRWLRQNLAHNGLSETRNPVVRADVLSWLRETDEEFDLILLDPPSFSNSSSLPGSFDVQRDHGGLIKLAMARLSEGGVLYFSNNRRKFRLDSQVSENYSLTDITEATLDRDFARRPGPHRCWKLMHRLPEATE